MAPRRGSSEVRERTRWGKCATHLGEAALEPDPHARLLVTVKLYLPPPMFALRAPCGLLGWDVFPVVLK